MEAFAVHEFRSHVLCCVMLDLELVEVTLALLDPNNGL